MSPRALLARIAGAKMMLSTTMAADAKANVASTQAAAISAELKREKLDAEMTADVMQRLMEIDWPPRARDELLASFAAPESSSRRKQQNYTSFLYFISAGLWAFLNATGVCVVAKKEALCVHLVRMGCVNPNEQTTKLANSLWMLVAMGDNAFHPSSYAKGQLKDKFHKTLKSINMRGASQYLHKLPQSVVEFKADYPDLFASLFSGDEQPVEPQVPVDKLMRLDAMYNCRNNHDFHVQSEMAFMPNGLSSMPSSQQLMQQGMPNMASSQQHMQQGVQLGIQLALQRSQSLQHTGDIPLQMLQKSPSLEQLQLLFTQRPALQDGWPPTPPPPSTPPPTSRRDDPSSNPTTPPPKVHDSAPESAEKDASSMTEKMAVALKKREESNVLKRPAAAMKRPAAAFADESTVMKRPAAAFAHSADEDEDEDEDDEDEDEDEDDERLLLKAKATKKGKKTPIPKVKARKIAVKHPAGASVKPSYSIEWSRNQVLGRTGKKGPGESITFKYGPGCDYKDVKRAEGASKKWVEEQKLKLGW